MTAKVSFLFHNQNIQIKKNIDILTKLPRYDIIVSTFFHKKYYLILVPPFISFLMLLQIYVV